MEKTITNLKLAAQKALLDDPRTEEHGIEALDDNRVITPNGSVPSRDGSEAGEKIVESVFGVISVINSLEIRERAQATLV